MLNVLTQLLLICTASSLVPLYKFSPKIGLYDTYTILVSQLESIHTILFRLVQVVLYCTLYSL